MENRAERTLSLCNVNYEDLFQELGNFYTNKSQISKLKIINTPIDRLEKRTFHDFENINHLQINQCNIARFEKHVFDTLTKLNSIDFSNNLVTIIYNDLFTLNHHLHTIILKNNRLQIIDKTVFSSLMHLETLDLSSNHIWVLVKGFLDCPNLKRLYLNHNNINTILPTAFNTLPNLTHLILNNNKIEVLQNTVFRNLSNLCHLNLNDNLINYIHSECFHELPQLKVLYLENNFITRNCYDEPLFARNFNLIDLNLAGNFNYAITSHLFNNCQQLKCLKLIVSRSFQISSVAYLKCLTEFELISNKNKFNFNYHFRNCIQNLKALTVLKLVFKKINDIRLCNFSVLQNLQCLHIECVEPSQRVHDFQMCKILPHSPRLKCLVFKKLNHFSVHNYRSEFRYVHHLNLSGIKGIVFPFCLNNTTWLAYLDLSFSAIESIAEHALDYCTNLRYFIIQYSKLKWIWSTSFVYNVKLELINCSHCCINTIEVGCFANLRNLRELNLSYNPLYNICDHWFDGLNREICVIKL